MELEFLLPKGVSIELVEAFLESLNKNQDKKPQKGEYHCRDCRFWTTNLEPYWSPYKEANSRVFIARNGHRLKEPEPKLVRPLQPYCGLFSCECTTKIGNGETPTRFQKKEEVSDSVTSNTT